MKKVKWALILILLAVVAYFVYLNWNFFGSRYSLKLEVPGTGWHQDIPELHNAVYLLIFFVMGFLLRYFIGLAERFGNRKTVKGLNERIADLELELQEEKKRHAAQFLPPEPAVPPAPAPPAEGGQEA